MTDLPRGVLAALVTPLTEAPEPDGVALIARVADGRLHIMLHHRSQASGAVATFPIYSGVKRYLLETRRAGGQGCISATLNLPRPLPARCSRNDKARTSGRRRIP